MTRSRASKKAAEAKLAAIKAAGWAAIAQAFGQKSGLLEDLAHAVFHEPRLRVIQALQGLACRHLPGNAQPRDPFAEFIGFCDRNPVPPMLGAKIYIFRTARDAYAAHRKKIVASCCLNHAAVTEEMREKWLREHCDVVEVEKLPQQYPPYAHWVCESEAIQKLWEKHCQTGKLHDRRGGRFPLFLLDHGKLQHIARHDRSTLYVDKADGSLIAFVIRDWCPQPGIIKGIVESVLEARGYKKNVRLDDPGWISHVGITAGARHQPGFDWARNLTSKKLEQDPEFIQNLRFRESSICAFFWNMAKGKLPSEVLRAYEDYLHKNFMPRMGGGTGSYVKLGNYHLHDCAAEGAGYPGVFEFEAAELAPPSAMFSINYSRYVSAFSIRIHKEGCPHKWTISWTLDRPEGPCAGGNFFITEYGIMIEAAGNSVVGWQPGRPHGTSLREVHPADQEKVVLEVGLSFATSPRLAKQWQRYMEANFSAEMREDIERELGEGGYDTDEGVDMDKF
ncbi:hypothetical protein L227DRAFT_515366 [Lentinus tigrinus ALCF2SS1-6]|uniref:Uncharacterized protein n=1 Tax=Lentinus tigrinus ALCF2SS1-6 TaxID=1328759 RepID=A0A5C2RNI6_9APHY|nr:hypothetical protein L227DRAFT_515366 [Lentinus tigrinus ALCF2SS1-6]